MNNSDVKNILRGKGMCGHIFDEEGTERACIRPIGHDERVHESDLDHLIGRKLDKVTITPLEPGDWSKSMVIMTFGRVEAMMTVTGPVRSVDYDTGSAIGYPFNPPGDMVLQNRAQFVERVLHLACRSRLGGGYTLDWKIHDSEMPALAMEIAKELWPVKQ
jgi:hypothetical protein